MIELYYWPAIVGLVGPARQALRDEGETPKAYDAS